MGRGHATQIGPPPIPICGPRDPRRRGKGEPMVGKRKGGRLGKGARVLEVGLHPLVLIRMLLMLVFFFFFSMPVGVVVDEI